MKPIAILVQYCLPKQCITALAGCLANWKGGGLTTAFIRWFVNRYKVNMDEAANSDLSSYARFNDFFTRPLKAGARPLANSDLICPVDGAISQFGPILHDQIYQAKGHSYSTLALVGGDPSAASAFNEGFFATLYLSPRDYHRIHMPCDGTLLSMTYVPGDLFSVNPLTAQHVPGLFARNERVVCAFSTRYGPMIMVLVGATIVGSMQTVWHGVVNPPRTGQLKTWTYTDQTIELKQGEEMGRFLLGSTVVMLLPAGPMTFAPSWHSSKPIRLGEAMATFAQ